MPKGDAARKKAAKREADEYIRVVLLLNRHFGTVTSWDHWDQVPTYQPLPPGALQHCPECLTAFRLRTWELGQCGWCGWRVPARLRC